MIHYSCDMCGKPLHSDKDVRYVVKVEVYAIYEEDDFDEDLFEDELDELDTQEAGEDKSDAEMEEFENGEYKTYRFDLCSECHNKCSHNPFLIKGNRKTRFSEN